MGLLSFLNKNKQESAQSAANAFSSSDDREFHSRAEEESNAIRNRGNASGKPKRAVREELDPVLPEKKRARRRLVGAFALILAAIVGVPMLLDSEPKPLAGDVAIQIPSRDKPNANIERVVDPSIPSAPASAAIVAPSSASVSASASTPAATAVSKPVTVASEAAIPRKPATTPAPNTNPNPNTSLSTAPPYVGAKPVVVGQSLDANEEVVDAKPATKPKVAASVTTKPTPTPKPASPTPVSKPVEAPKLAHAENKPDNKPDAEHKPAKPAEAEHKPAKPVARAENDDAERAKAILEGRAEGKNESRAAETDNASQAKSGSKFLVQVAALATQEKVDELQGKLRDAGLKSHAQKVTTASGERTRVRLGPFSDKQEAEKARAKLQALGLSGSLVPMP